MTSSPTGSTLRSFRPLALRVSPLTVSFALLAASCSDDEPERGCCGPNVGGFGGMGMAGNSAGGASAGTGGMPMAGSGGMGMAGGGGMGGSAMGGNGGAGMGAGGAPVGAGGGTGVIEVLNDDAAALLVPTTAAIVDDTVWVAIGQLNQLFEQQPAPSLPFRAVSIPLAGGPVGAESIVLGNDDDFYLEGIAAGGTGELFLGALVRGQIARVAPGTTGANPFMDAGLAERGVVGLAVDSDREVLWYCDSSPVAAQPGGALVGVSTAGANAGDEVVRHELPVNLVASDVPDVPDVDAGLADAGVDAGQVVPPVASPDAGAAVEVAPFCNDVIVLDDGDLLVTESSGRLFRVAAADALNANSAEVWLDDPALRPPALGGFGANGLDIVGGSLIVANSDTGELLQIDPDSSDPASTLRRLSLSEAGAAASLCGPDGLATVPGSDTELVVVENSFCAAGVARVVKVTLNLD